MAQVKITDLAAYADPVSTDVLPVVDVTADTTKKVSIATLLKNASLGTAALPGIAFDGDPNTGLYSPGADQVAISTAGTGRLFINSSGAVGIGTSSPTSFTTIKQSANSAAGGLAIEVSGTDSRLISYFDSGQDAWLLNATYGSSGAYKPLSFLTSDVRRLTIDTSGNVGIGTSSPAYKLHVSGDQISLDDSSGTATLNIGTTNNGNARLKFWEGGIGGGNGYSFGMVGASNALSIEMQGTGEIVRFASDGKVGIGTTSPNSPLTIESSAGNQVKITYPSIASYFLNATSGGDFAINKDGTERLRIDSSGRLLVGTSTAQGTSIFQAVGNSAASTDPGDIRIIRGVGVSSIGGNVGAGLGCIKFGALENTVCATIEAQSDGTWSSTSDTPGRLVFSTTADGASSPTERMRIKSNGQVLVAHGTSASVIQAESSITSGYANSIFVARFTGYSPNETGNYFFYGEDTTGPRAYIRSNGGLVNYQANDVNLSDRNAKKDISPAAGTWDCIKGWEIVNYRYKDQPDNADLNLGVIAQQVAESCPEVITIFEEAKDDQPEKLGVKEQQMYWMAIKALQEAQVRIEALEAEVAALKAQ